MQTWHQLLTRHCQHSVLFNQDEFLLCYRDGQSLYITPPYKVTPSEADESCSAATALAYFIAHGMIQRFPGGDNYEPAVRPGEMQAVGANVGPAVEAGSHYRTSSTGTVVGVQPRASVCHWCLLSLQSYGLTISKAAQTLTGNALSSAALGFGLHPSFNLASKASGVNLRLSELILSLHDTFFSMALRYRLSLPSSLVFKTSGVASSPLKLVPRFHGALPLSSLISRPLILDELIHPGEKNYVIRGAVGDMPLVGKLAWDQSQMDLENELRVYNALTQLQGSAIPQCLGLFEVGSFGLILLLEYCGETIRSFDELSLCQR